MFSDQRRYLLAIDTSCDDTSLALLNQNTDVVANIISSQIKIHEAYGGVVPELASRAHAENLPFLFRQLLHDHNITEKNIAGIAVTHTPGLLGCLLVGTSFSKALAYAENIPLFQVNHLEGHLFSPFIGKENIFPFLGLVVSGGHTAFYSVNSFDDIVLIGQTVDDAVGEVYDKVAKILGLGYPGGPVIDSFAARGDSKKFPFKIARVKMGEQYLSFSGLKTAVFQCLEGKQLVEQEVYDLCASVQAILVKTLCRKIKFFCEQKSFSAFALSGGVAMNSLLRQEVVQLCQQMDLPCFIADKEYCTDNAAMIGYIALKSPQRADMFDLNCLASQKIQAKDLKKQSR